MKVRRTFHTIDTHTGGEPTRNVVGGIPNIPGTTMKDKMLYMKEQQDWIRQTLTYEPRGNEVMSGTVITPPCDPSADVGVLYFEVGGWMPMCGHDTIGVATALLESGMVAVEEPVTTLTLDTAAGLVRVSVQVEDGMAKSVSFVNAPSLVLRQDAVLYMPEYGEIILDIAYGGNIYAILPASSVGLTLLPEHSRAIISVGNCIKELVNRDISVVHPELPFMDHVTHVEFYEGPSESESVVRNAVVIPPGAIDRSPCGTGTSAKMAVLYAKGLLGVGESFVHESIIGSRFHCRIVETSAVAGHPAIIPEVTGCAFVTGIHTFVIDPDDPMPHGFLLG
jgi:proline racemase